MTVTPTAPGGAVPLGAALTSPTGAPVPPEAAAGFLSLLMAAMPGQAKGQPGAAPAEGVLHGPVEQRLEAPEQGTVPTDPALLAALGLAGGVPQPVPTVPGTAPATQAQVGQTTASTTAPTTPTTTPTGTTTTGDATSTGVPAATVGNDAGPAVVGTPAPAGTDATATVPVPTTTDGTSPGTASQGRTGDDAAPSTPGTALPTDGTSSGTGPQGRTGDDVTPPAGDAGTTGTTAAAASAPTGAPAAATTDATQALSGVTAPTAPAGTDARTTGPAAPNPVAEQVFPEVTRMVSRGDGTHRVTLTLTPEALGDVRVTLVVRNGEVTVTFAAADQAQQALMESAPELRRLLELTGATDTRVLVRDSAAPAPAGSTSGSGSDQPGTQTGTDSRSGTGAQTPDGQRERTDHHAGTRGGQIAMDGTHRGTGTSSQPHDPALDTRTGVDVTV